MSPWTYLAVMSTICIGAFIVSIVANKKTVGNRYGWISPNGNVFECGPDEHTFLAKQIVGEICPTPNPEKYLMNQGWIKYSKNYNKKTKGYCFTVGVGDNKEFTDTQIEILGRMGFNRLQDFLSCHNTPQRKWNTVHDSRKIRTNHISVDELLPIGSVVLLKDGEKRLMIIGILQTDIDGSGKDYDYLGVLYPEGHINNELKFLFNHDDIEEIFFRGFEDEERLEFISGV